MTVYATWNPLDKQEWITLSNGDLTLSTSTGTDKSVRATIGISSGKCYWEVALDAYISGRYVGIATDSMVLTHVPGVDIHGWSVESYVGDKWHNNVDTACCATAVADDIVCIALDMDTGKIWFGINGVWCDSGDPATGINEAFSGITGRVFPTVGHDSTAPMVTTANFGATTFDYTVPEGFDAGVIDYSTSLKGDFTLSGGVFLGSVTNPIGQFVLSGETTIQPAIPIPLTIENQFQLLGAIEVSNSLIETSGRFNLIGDITLSQESRYAVAGQFLLSGSVESGQSSPIFESNGRFILSGVTDLIKSSVIDVNNQFLLSGNMTMTKEINLALDGLFVLSGRVDIDTEGLDCSLPDNSMRWC